MCDATTPTDNAACKLSDVTSNPSLASIFGCNRRLPNLDLKPEEMASVDFGADRSAHVRAMGAYLSDSYRIDVYRHAILSNRHLFKDKVVLEVHCQIGILSMFAVKAGAKKVYATNRSNVIDYTARIVKANNLEGKIILLKGFIEQIALNEKVDIIISDWMGSALFYQSALDSVIYARDHFLRPNGIIFPDLARFYIVGVSEIYLKRSKFNWWRDVHEFNMKVMGEWAETEPCTLDINPKNILTSAELIGSLNLNKITRAQFYIQNIFKFDVKQTGRMNAIATFFEVEFTKAHTPVCFCTAPGFSSNFFQVVCFLKETMNVLYGKAVQGYFRISEINMNSNNIELLFSVTNQKFNYFQRWLMKASCYMEYNIPLAAFGINATGNAKEISIIANEDDGNGDVEEIKKANALLAENLSDYVGVGNVCMYKVTPVDVDESACATPAENTINYSETFYHNFSNAAATTDELNNLQFGKIENYHVNDEQLTILSDTFNNNSFKYDDDDHNNDNDNNFSDDVAATKEFQ